MIFILINNLIGKHYPDVITQLMVTGLLYAILIYFFIDFVSCNISDKYLICFFLLLSLDAGYYYRTIKNKIIPPVNNASNTSIDKKITTDTNDVDKDINEKDDDEITLKHEISLNDEDSTLFSENVSLTIEKKDENKII